MSELENQIKKRQVNFHRFAVKVANFIGSTWVFVTMLVLVLIWLASGPFFKFSDTWQLIINTSTTIITFLIVFIIQNTQNRDTIALQLKLDELIRVHKLAHYSIIDLDKLSDDEIKQLEMYYKKISEKEKNE